MEIAIDYTNMTPPCGLDCFNCLKYLANEIEKLRNIIAERLNITLERAVCGGCQNENGTIAFLSMPEQCSAYKCSENRGIIFLL